MYLYNAKLGEEESMCVACMNAGIETPRAVVSGVRVRARSRVAFLRTSWWLEEEEEKRSVGRAYTNLSLIHI